MHLQPVAVRMPASLRPVRIHPLQMRLLLRSGKRQLMEWVLLWLIALGVIAWWNLGREDDE